MKKLKEKTCLKCGANYTPSGTRQYYCGSIRERTGCSRLMLVERTNIKNHQPLVKQRRAACTKKYVEKHRSENTEKAKKWRAYSASYAKTEKGKESAKRSRAKNKDSIEKIRRAYLARKLGAEGSHTNQEWESLKKLYNFCCGHCGISEADLSNKWFGTAFIKLTRDHIIPLSKGGSDYIGNIMPLCVSCNSKKKDGHEA